MNRVESGQLYDRWPTPPDDRVVEFLDADQAAALDGVRQVYGIERRRAETLFEILGAGQYVTSAVEHWRGPRMTAAAAEDRRQAENAVRAGSPLPAPKAVPALRAEAGRLDAERPAIVAVANERLAALEAAMVAGRDGLITRIDNAIARAKDDPRAGAEEVLDLVEVLAWAIGLPDRFDLPLAANRERTEVAQARAVIASAPARALARVRATLTAEEVPA